jgi:spermidine synthase
MPWAGFAACATLPPLMPTPPPSPPTRRTPILIPACFFLSGFAGLALEMVWSRMLSLHIGGSAEAVTAVVTAYMGGLGLGSLAAASFARRVRRPIRLYALLEIAVALFALASPLLLRAPDGLYRLAHDYEEVSRALPFAVRFATSMLLLMVPTFAMGATLPLLVEDLTRRGGGYASRVAVLYGINTVGAVAGTVAAGFWLLPGFGNTATLAVAAALDLLVAALLFVGPARRDTPVATPETTSPVADVPVTPRPARPDHRPQRGARPAAGRAAPTRTAAPEPALTPLHRRLVLAVFALSGALAMVYELGWTRRLASLLGSSVYSFALLLAVFLGGLGLGSLLVAPLLRLVRSPLLALAAALGLAGIAALAGTALLNAVPGLLRELLLAHQREPQAILTGQLGMAALVLLPAALLLGAVFPLAARVVHRAGEGGGQAIGHAYAINTAGTVLGAAGAGLFLLPALGSLAALNAAALTHAALGAALALIAPGRWPVRIALAGGLILAAAGVRWVMPEHDLYRLNYGVVSLLRDIDRGVGPPPSLEERERQETGPLRLLSIEEGRTATVAVVSRWDQRQLVINGKVDASSADPTEVLLGQLPMILADSARRVLVIGYGSGITTHSALTHPVERVETVEIEPAVVAAGRFFADLNGQQPPDPRSVIHFEDGRTHLTYTRATYDVIISEPSNPWIAGINNLFTSEFYRLVRDRLAPDGLFCQWFHGYDMSRETFASLLGTLGAAFPGAEVYRLNLDFLVIWKRSGAFPTRARFERALANPAVRADLARMGFVRPSDLFALYLGPIDAVAPREWRPNTDDNGLVEFRAPLDLLRRSGRDAWNTPSLATLALERYDETMPRAAALSALAEGLMRRRDLDRMRDLMTALAPEQAGLRAVMSEAIARAEVDRAGAARAGLLMIQSDQALEAKDFTRCEALLAEALALRPDDPDLLFRQGNAQMQLGRAEAAEAALLAALREREAQLVWRVGSGEPYQAELMLGIIASTRGAFDQAIARFTRARDLNPYQTVPYLLLGATHEVMGRMDDSRREVAAGLAVDPRDEKLLEIDRRLRGTP